ncbi:MAG TPA: NAD-dependent epimerase/dehydratase family protein [Candidatus Nanopelagicales bacterium]|nr:NAD-dependent epimerase/dehydratase family protein [Candidatus Nanopelagicales bacterium]
MTQRTHLVVGAGPIGSAVVRRVVASGDRARVVTRSGSGPDLPGVEKVAADAADARRLAELATGCDVVYNCVNPAYHRWATDWPPVAAALLGAAESADAVLVTTANLYGYGHVDRRITEDMPLQGGFEKADVRNRMWLDALAAHEAGRVRVTEARGADYVGPGAESHLGERVLPKVLAGKKAQVMRSLDTNHTWTYTEDMAMTLVAIGGDERAWGRAWHVPSALEMSQREAITTLAAMAGAPAPRLSEYSPALIRTLGLFSPLMRELPDVSYQMGRDFLMDSSAAQRELGLVPTPADAVLAAHLAPFLSGQARHAA